MLVMTTYGTAAITIRCQEGARHQGGEDLTPVASDLLVDGVIRGE